MFSQTNLIIALSVMMSAAIVFFFAWHFANSNLKTLQGNIKQAYKKHLNQKMEVLLEALYELFKEIPKYNNLSDDVRDSFNRALGSAHREAINTVVGGVERKDAQFGVYVVRLYFGTLPREIKTEYFNKVQIEDCANKIQILFGENNVDMMLEFLLYGNDDFEEEYQECLEYIRGFHESMK